MAKTIKKPSKPKEFTIFNLIPFIVNSKPKWESLTLEQQKTFNPYMINKLLSFNSNYLELINYVAGLNIQDDDKIYKIYCDLIPKQFNTYFPYIKGKSKTFNTELVKLISEYYICSFKEANEYLELLNKEDLNEILVSKGIEDKEIKKLIK
mgnify:CR=1 FL=1